MIFLPLTLSAWKTDDFEQTFKKELAEVSHDQLPLQKALSLSSYVSEDKVSPILIRASETGTQLLIKAGVFYTGIIAGCSCADDPTPLDTQNEYCEILLDIDLATAEASVQLVEE